MQVINFFTKWIPLFFIQDMYENNMPERRYAKTLSFLQEQLPPPANIIDLGVINPFSERMLQAGYKVFNTGGEDLDEVRTTVEEPGYDCCTAFEIFEHLLSPYELLKSIKAPELVGSIPLNVWFAPPNRNPNDPPRPTAIRRIRGTGTFMNSIPGSSTGCWKRPAGKW